MIHNHKESITDFLEQCRTVARLRHLAYSTEQSDVATIRRFITFHGRKHTHSTMSSG